MFRVGFFTRAATYLIFFPFFLQTKLHDIETLDKRGFVFPDAGVWRNGWATIPHWDGSCSSA
jgi:hypothetical protein